MSTYVDMWSRTQLLHIVRCSDELALRSSSSACLLSLPPLLTSLRHYRASLTADRSATMRSPPWRWRELSTLALASLALLLAAQAHASCACLRRRLSAWRRRAAPLRLPPSLRLASRSAAARLASPLAAWLREWRDCAAAAKARRRLAARCVAWWRRGGEARALRTWRRAAAARGEARARARRGAVRLALARWRRGGRRRISRRTAEAPDRSLAFWRRRALPRALATWRPRASRRSRLATARSAARRLAALALRQWRTRLLPLSPPRLAASRWRRHSALRAINSWAAAAALAAEARSRAAHARVALVGEAFVAWHVRFALDAVFAALASGCISQLRCRRRPLPQA
ncbi:hypothetical protein AB1Y20_020840 [Prymnesium parvum]|uniref:Uncharacterized protein n=1 Tax=Prymnesium parvum TaxID=97485 RepID=A0AB34JUQ7_PRYPA